MCHHILGTENKLVWHLQFKNFFSKNTCLLDQGDWDFKKNVILKLNQIDEISLEQNL